MPTDPRTTLPTYINTFDRAKGFQALAFHYDRFLLGHELNVAQDIERDRVRAIGDAFWRDGTLISGGKIVLGPIVANTVEARLDAAKVYIRGSIHDIDARVFIIPAVGVVFVGIRLRTYTVTNEDDPTLKGLAPSTRAQGEPGASALVMKGKWGWNGDGEDGDFFPIYTIRDGVLDTDTPTIDDSWLNLLARYDREAHGGYVVEGFRVQALGFDGTHQTFTVSEGTINVWGFKRTRPAAFRMRIPEEPEIQLIDDEPHAVGSGEQTIAVRFAPIAEVVEVTIIAEKTVTLTHGAYSGVSDALPDPTVLSISEVKQGSTTYAATTDYRLTGAAVDWSPGGAEPAPGSTYTIKYRYLASATPTAVTATTFKITGAADGTVCYVKYRMKLPRYDAIVVDQAGTISYLKGISSLYAAQPLQVAATLVKLADVRNNWGGTPAVTQVGTIRMPFADLRDLESMVGDLYALVAEERLQRDVDRKEVSSKRGVFVDPFLDDDMRDQGVPQTGAIFGGFLWLPITPTVTTLPLAAVSLGGTDEFLFQQSLITGETRINPYAVFGRPATDVTLDPSVDLWTEVIDLWTSITTARNVQTHGWTEGGTLVGQSTEVTERILSTTEKLETIRSRQVEFTVRKWGPHELLTKVTFDDIVVTPTGTIRADETGTVRSSFTIPAGVPCGVKHVAFEGLGGSSANALYTAYGWKTTVSHERTTLTINYWSSPDPVAQTYRLAEPRQIDGVDIKVTKVGDPTKPVRVQLREVELGMPTEKVVAEALLDMRTVTVVDVLSTNPRQESDWTTVRFETPVTEREDRSYAVTLLTADPLHSVAIADLGGFDQLSGWVTSNAFPNGTFVDGQDGRTWLAKPGRSLVFRLRGKKYAPTTLTVEAGTMTVTNCTDLLPLLAYERPEHTAIEIEFETPDGAKYVTGPAVNVELPSAVTGDVKVRLRLIGTAALSPLLMPYIQVVAGALQATGDYVGRAFPCGTDGKIRAIMDVYLPSTATAGMSAQTGISGGSPVWTPMSLERATPLGDGWEERQYVLDHISIAETRVKAVLTGGPGARARGRGLRAVAVPSTTGA
ncbi:DUF4815 domain-containing protein [Rhodoplanes elegans]|uniref:DUF4815 domain-containing protein n=1 Tax=Rhodoplanes elegans TaxID=29408 RepID=A0A327KJ52_9BRAD|nr:DUF4815 domain-containing protein [Rhodoplanes elegans]MBK5961128.1 DUF4815 domain-containing protein [Rhodoplanes elegans]RAI38156.1 DUF4815 domain-containing protein [Rhodoplanes elegans]